MCFYRGLTEARPIKAGESLGRTMRGKREDISTGTRIGIAGGAFDPPHYGHLVLASIALNSGAIDEVWLVPSGNRPDKVYRVSLEERLELLRLLVESGVPTDERRVQVSLIEVEEPDIIGTVELFRVLRVRHPGCTFRAIIGSDLVKDLPRWRHAEALRKEVSFVVIPRPQAGGDNSKVAPKGLEEFQLEWVSSEFSSMVSSSIVRGVLEEGGSVMGLMPATLIDFIKRRGLYTGR